MARQSKAAQPTVDLTRLAAELVAADQELVDARRGATAAAARSAEADDRLEKAHERYAKANNALQAAAGGAK